MVEQRDRGRAKEEGSPPPAQKTFHEKSSPASCSLPPEGPKHPPTPTWGEALLWCLRPPPTLSAAPLVSVPPQDQGYQRLGHKLWEQEVEMRKSWEMAVT